MKIMKEKTIKYQWFFFYISILAILNLNNSKIMTKTKARLYSKVQKNLKEYFYVQRLYPALDPLDMIIESENRSGKHLIEVNDSLIVMTPDINRSGEIEDSINIKDIYDPKYDRIENAKCCNRVTYEEYSPDTSIHSIIPAIKSTVTGKKLIQQAKAIKNGATCTNPKLPLSKRANPINSPSVSKKKAKAAKAKPEKMLANFCILIFVPNEARWRICNYKKSSIKKLQLKITYSVVKLKSKNNFKILNKLIQNPNILTTPPMSNWSWDDQDKWTGMCQSKRMQSPINIPSAKAQRPHLNFQMHMKLAPSHVLVKKILGN